MKLFLCTFALLSAYGGTPLEEKKREDSKEDVAKEQQAKVGATVIEQACKKYYLENSKWPDKLADIANLLESGKKGLIDPWGKEFKFAIGKTKASDGTEVERPYIWTERTVDGKTKVYGMKPDEKKAEDSKEDAEKEQKAKDGAKLIEQALKKYYLENGGVDWPAKLDEIAGQLEDGKKALIDPWGKEYKFKIVSVKIEDGIKIERPYVWTERKVDGKTKVYGMKPPEEKKRSESEAFSYLMRFSGRFSSASPS